jgi:hypothetical protein
MTDVPNSKRPRLSLPVALSQQQQQLDNYPHAGQEDIINFFAKRGSRLREMEDEQAENSSTIAKLKEVSENLRIEVASVKASHTCRTVLYWPDALDKCSNVVKIETSTQRSS